MAGGTRMTTRSRSEATRAPSSAPPGSNPDRLTILRELEKKVLWLASWTIHHANHVRDHADGLKVGGHQASSASLATIMTALYFDALRPQDRVAVKPTRARSITRSSICSANRRASGWKRSAATRARRAIRRAPRTSTMSTSPPVRSASAWRRRCFRPWCRTTCARMAGAWSAPEGRMIALVGDAELDEGNIFEAILEGWKQDLRNCWWIIDYNRQSLDAVVREGLWAALRIAVPQFRLGCRHPQIRLAVGGGLRRAGRRKAAHLDRHLSQPALLRAGVSGRRRLAQAPARRHRRPGRRHATDRGALRRRACPADDQSRRARSRLPDASVSRHRS